MRRGDDDGSQSRTRPCSSSWYLNSWKLISRPPPELSVTMFISMKAPTPSRAMVGSDICGGSSPPEFLLPPPPPPPPPPQPPPGFFASVLGAAPPFLAPGKKASKPVHGIG